MDEISILLERFFSSKKNDTFPYFDVDELEDLINYFLEKEDLANLNKTIELGYKLHPDDLSFKLTICRTLMATDDYESALDIVEDLENSGNSEVDLLRIECLCELDRYNEALKIINELIEVDVPYLEDILVQTACILNDIDGYVYEAYSIIQRGLMLYPDNYELKIELCFNYELQGKAKKAIDFCHELIDENAYAADAWFILGRLYSTVLDFEKAIDALDYALTCLNEDETGVEYDIRLLKAYCLLMNKSYDKAIACYEDLVEFDEFDKLYVYPYIAECYINICDYEKAYQLLSSLVGVDGLEDEVSVYGNLIFCCFETNRRDEAFDLLGQALANYPESILEYISKLNIIRKQSQGDSLGDHNVIAPNNLSMEYMRYRFHNN